MSASIPAVDPKAILFHVKAEVLVALVIFEEVSRSLLKCDYF